jgi:hypothetical protein
MLDYVQITAKLSLWPIIKQRVKKAWREKKVHLHAVLSTTHKMEFSFTPRSRYSGERPSSTYWVRRLRWHQGWRGRCEKLKNAFYL